MKRVCFYEPIFTLMCIIAKSSGTQRADHALQVGSKKNMIGFDNFVANVQTQSKLACAKECSRNPVCSSFFYKRETSECRIHGLGEPDENSALVPRDGFKYYQIADRVVSTPTTTTTEQPTTVASGCISYSNNFQVTRQRVVYGDALESIPNTPVSSCKQKCINAVGYTCKYFEILLLGNTCYLQDRIPAPSEYQSSPYFDYYERVCEIWA